MTALPLASRFPGTAALPHVELGDWPTPATSSPELAEGLGLAALWLKRDDVSARAYGGNKVRKLEFLLGEAQESGREVVITFGAYGSNHVLATAVHAARLGIAVHAVLLPQPVTASLRKNLLADVAAGVTFHLADSYEDSLRVAATVRSELRLTGIEPLVIPFGGTTARGTLGFVNAAFELADQIQSGVLPEPDVVYVPFGSMGTAAGLAIGFAAEGIRARVQAVRVLPAAEGDSNALTRTIAEAVAALRESDSDFPPLEREDLALDVRGEFLGEGYALPTPAATEAVRTAADAGLSLETTYTGKSLAALTADARSGQLAGASVVFWNTYSSRPLALGDASKLPDELGRMAQESASGK
jgi:D-cysteine desulfhydrase